MCNLLTSLNLSSGQLLYKQDPTSIRKFVEETDSTVSSIVSALQYAQLLDKIQKGKLTPTFIQTDVTKLMYEAITAKQYKWSGVNLSLHGARTMRATDTFFLSMIMSELLDNSCRYRSDAVTVSVDAAGDKTRVQIIDDGEGIEPSELAHVFEPYFRIKKHRQRNRRAGLGLTTVQAITDQLEGKIKLDSHPDWGTKVEIII